MTETTTVDRTRLGINDRYPFPAYPNGWFRVAYSKDLAKGDVKALKYFGTDLVVFRDEEGTAHVTDAFCGHLGAHLGHGGKVEGCAIRCPFHAWKWDGKTGSLLDVPYAKRLPRADIKAWPTVELNGIVMVWHHAEDKAPTFEIPLVPETEKDAGYTEPSEHYWKIRSRWLDMNENAVDNVHFKYIHGTPGIPESFPEVRDHILEVKNITKMTTPRGPIEAVLVTIDHGPGFQIVRIDGAIKTVRINTATPIDEHYSDVSFTYAVEDKGGNVGAARIKDLLSQFENDLPVWENKAYFKKPRLCDGDGKFGLYRKWMKQFFSCEW